jgi:hypothetical protein
MASKAKSKTAATTAGAASTTLTVTDDEGGKSRHRKIAELGFSAAVTNTVTASHFAKGSFGALDLSESISVKNEKIAKVKAGDMPEVEATLIAQAVTLDTVFNELARRAAANMGAHTTATETYLRLAFKAQAQCRATLETLAEVKNPRHATFVHQQNIANQQQVNNGGDNTTSTRAPAPAQRKSSNRANELLEAQHGEWMDTGATGKAGGTDPHVEAVGMVNGR